MTRSYPKQNQADKVPTPLYRLGMLVEAGREHLTLAETRLYALFLERCGPKYGGELKIGNEELAHAIDMDIHSVIAGLKGLREKRLLFSRRNKHGPSTHSPFHDFQDGSPSAHDPHFQDGVQSASFATPESAGFATPVPLVKGITKGTYSEEGEGESERENQNGRGARPRTHTQGVYPPAISKKTRNLIFDMLGERDLEWADIRTRVPGFSAAPPALVDLTHSEAQLVITWLKDQPLALPDCRVAAEYQDRLWDGDPPHPAGAGDFDEIWNSLRDYFRAEGITDPAEWGDKVMRWVKHWLDVSFVEDMEKSFGGLNVGLEIDRALNHRAVQKQRDFRVYVHNWLVRSAEGGP